MDGPRCNFAPLVAIVEPREGVFHDFVPPYQVVVGGGGGALMGSVSGLASASCVDTMEQEAC